MSVFRRFKLPQLLRKGKSDENSIPRNLNFLGKTAFLEGIFCLEYPSRRSEKVNSYFTNYRFSFRKLQIFISQTTDSHFANYRFSFRKLQIFISQTTDFHFANHRFSFRFVPFRFISFRFAPFRFTNYSKPNITAIFSVTIIFVNKIGVVHTICHQGATNITCSTFVFIFDESGLS